MHGSYNLIDADLALVGIHTVLVEAVGGGLKMPLGSVGSRELIPQEIVANEEGVGSGEPTADEAVTFGSAELFECRETGTEEAFASPTAFGVVRDHEGSRGADRGVVFDHDDARPDAFDGTPHPIVVHIDIDAE
jgi:hypothetical protein